LISNAIKYTEKGLVNILIFIDDNQWIIQVKDTGIGIPKNALPNIFESFSQVDGSRTRKHEGFGLGLSIVKQLTDLMDGDIIVESLVGEGTVFTVKLPIIEEVQVNEMNMLQEELA
jgi:signal transduction histidine kinase